MIISHRHKFIFIKLRKTAGTSVEIALSKICGEQDVITPITPKDEQQRRQLGYRTAQNYRIPWQKYNRKDWAKFFLYQRRPAFFNHMPAKYIKRNLTKEVWDSYFKFCIDRNPWDKIVSDYYWRGEKAGYSSIMDYLNSGLRGRIIGYDMYSEYGIPIVDKVYRFEDLDEVMLDLNDRLQLNGTLQLPDYKAKSGFRKENSHYRDILTAEEVKLIQQIYAREIDFLGYRF